MPYRITQCYMPPDSGDIPAFTPAEAGTRLSDLGGMQDLPWRRSLENGHEHHSVSHIQCL